MKAYDVLYRKGLIREPACENKGDTIMYNRNVFFAILSVSLFLGLGSLAAAQSVFEIPNEQEMKMLSRGATSSWLNDSRLVNNFCPEQ